MRSLPYTYLAKGKYWYFRHNRTGTVRIEGEPFSPHFMWHYRQLMAKSGAKARQTKARQRVRRAEQRLNRRADSYVYFIGVEPEGPVKIGLAKDVRQRLATLQVAVSQPLKVLAVAEGGMARERDYHRRFDAIRMRGEWFERAPELLAEIASLGAPE